MNEQIKQRVAGSIVVAVIFTIVILLSFAGAAKKGTANHNKIDRVVLKNSTASGRPVVQFNTPDGKALKVQTQFVPENPPVFSQQHQAISKVNMRKTAKTLKASSASGRFQGERHISAMLDFQRVLSNEEAKHKHININHRRSGKINHSKKKNHKDHKGKKVRHNKPIVKDEDI